MKRVHKGILGALVVVVLGTVLVYVMRLDKTGVGIVENIPEGLPEFKISDLTLDNFSKLIPLALTISIVAFMEAFSVAKVTEPKRINSQI